MSLIKDTNEIEQRLKIKADLKSAFIATSLG